MRVERWIAWTLGSVLAVLLTAPTATADPTSSARVEPAVAEPGDEVSLIFSTTSPDLLEVIVQGRVTCTVSGPNGTQDAPCDRPGTLVEARVLGPEQVEYVFPYEAPAALGNYTVHFELNALLILLPQEYQADTRFMVAPEGTLGDGRSGGGGNGPGGGTGPGGDDGAGDGTAGTGKEAGGSGGGTGHLLRWLASTSVGLGVLLVTLGARRFGFGGF